MNGHVRVSGSGLTSGVPSGMTKAEPLAARRAGISIEKRIVAVGVCLKRNDKVVS